MRSQPLAGLGTHRRDAGATKVNTGAKSAPHGPRVMTMSMSLVDAYILTGAILFATGVVGFLARRNLIVMFLSTEIMFQGVILNLVGFGVRHMDITGQTFAVFLLVIAAVEAGLALGLVVLLYRRTGSLDAAAWQRMQG